MARVSTSAHSRVRTMLAISDGGVVALPGYFIVDTPWAGVKSEVGTWTRSQASTRLAGGTLNSGGVQNDEHVKDYYFSAGTFKVALIHYAFTDTGIHSFQHDGGTVATIDGYNATPTENTYAEVTGIAVIAGLKVHKILMATKHASSGGYAARVDTYAWVRTGV